jgi:trans-2,3-dihydro-3-hydroxyanthranilate isomerase
MSNPVFYIVDVFAEEKYTGNQLAVVRGAGDLAGTEMQAIASEMNYSETTFIVSEEAKDGAYDVRIFTPREEVPFAGHPTLGTAYVIAREMEGEPIEHIVLNLEAGRIPVSLADVCWMRQPSPTFGDAFTVGCLSQVLGLEETELDERFPVQEVSTGLPCIIVPLKSLEALRRCRVDRDAYYGLLSHTRAKAILVFSPEPYEVADLSTRFFAEYYGVPEDPATGSANGCLAAYLVENGYSGVDPMNMRVEQGYEIGRPSLLYLHAERAEGEITVSVGGKVRMVARGELL